MRTQSTNVAYVKSYLHKLCSIANDLWMHQSKVGLRCYKYSATVGVGHCDSGAAGHSRKEDESNNPPRREIIFFFLSMGVIQGVEC